MEGTTTTNTQNHAQPNNNHHHLTHQLQQLENEQWQHLRQTENDRRSREAIQRHLQPYIETERLRQQQQHVQQLQQQYRLQQQLLSLQQKRLTEELKWIQRHQQKQAASIEKQRQKNVLLGGGSGQVKRVEVDLVVQKESDSWGRQQEAPVVGQQPPREPWELIPSTKEQVQMIGGYQQLQHQQQQQQASHPKSHYQYHHHQTEFEQQQGQQQVELGEKQRREKQALWELYKLRKQQEQETVERRQKQQQQQQQHALLSNKLHQEKQSSPKMEGVYSELINSGPPPVQESNKVRLQHIYNRPLIPAPLNWVQSTFADNTTNNSNQGDIEHREHGDDEELDEDYPGQHYNQQQHDWRDLRRLSKVYVPLPRRKRGRKGRGDLFEDDYHAGFNRIEIHALSTAGKAAYEAQRQRRQHHEASPPLPPVSAMED